MINWEQDRIYFMGLEEPTFTTSKKREQEQEEQYDEQYNEQYDDKLIALFGG